MAGASRRLASPTLMHERESHGNMHKENNPQNSPGDYQSKDATTGERLETSRLLLKILASTTKGKPRGRSSPQKATAGRNDVKEGLGRILSAVNGKKDQARLA
jgi:hypothetical protein